ncbi:MAG: patatin-like phospholipase family protein [Candidatus Obscuribacterales bacterium]|nr:patatin-like phospholipase family protein [Steroidobacteraceae bacterium]
MSHAKADAVTLNEVQLKESESILRRRSNRGIADHSTFDELAKSIDIPDAQWSETLTNLFVALGDKAQDLAWKTHADKNPQRKGIANLVGLALSGGGIRSATFNLGVLQVLAWTKLLNAVDYLSTVSGGGYIGACISSMFASPLKSFPFEHKHGQKEGAIFRHLRNNAEYLAPRGAIDYLRIPMTVMRGMIVNLLVILPYLLLAAIVTALIHPTSEEATRHWMYDQWSWLSLSLGRTFIGTKLLLIAIALSFVLFPVYYMLFQRTANWSMRDATGKFYGGLLLLTGVIAFVELQPVAISWLIAQHSANKLNLSMLTGIAATQAAIPAAISVWLMRNAEKLVAKYALALLGLSALAVFWSIYLWMSVVLIQGQYATAWSTLCIPILVVLVLLAYGIFFVDVNHTSVHSFYRDRLSKAYIVKQAAQTDPSDSSVELEQNDRQLLSELNTDYSPYHLINTAINLQCHNEGYRRGRHADAFIFSRHFVGSEPTGYCDTKEMESQSRQLNLATAMSISGAAAAPNMGKQTNHLFAFFLAMLNVRLNYWLPNPRHVFCRPGARAKVPRSPSRRVGPLYLLREMFGRLTDKSRNVNLSDGGHFDNLGLYELFRRECRFIICGDGEADPRLSFGGLANALRMAQVDFGIIVEMKGLDHLRFGIHNHALGKIRYSDGRIGWLLYLKQSLRGDSKLATTFDAQGYSASSKPNDYYLFDDGAYIAEYKSCNPSFPHQSTGDQFFDESQFECTRAVGYNVAYRTLCR